MLLDDDVTFPSDFVEKLGIVASTENADVIVPSTSQQGHSVLKSVLIDFYNVLTLTRTKMFFEKEYLAKITAWGGYKVKSHVDRNKNYKTQTGIGICGLCKLCALKASEFKDDLWLDKYGYALPDDQVMYYKMYLRGYKLIASPSNTFVHLDARAGHVSDEDHREKEKKSIRLSCRNFTIFWYLYVWKYKVGLGKFWSLISFFFKMFVSCLANLGICLLKRNFSCALATIDGYKQAFQEIKDEVI